jgi:predicted transcriptional regulator of viral defense system
MQSKESSAIELIRASGGIIRTIEAIEKGIHPRTLYSMRDKGVLIQLSRGVYQLFDDHVEDVDLTVIATKIPKCVICLISALSFHEITTQIPHAVSVALIKGAETPRLDFPPVNIYRFSDKPFHAGIESHELGGVIIRVYCPEKTIADCFKFRNKIGMDIALEALKLYKERKKFNIQALLKYAAVCRVENIMRPYLEALI